MNENEIDGEEEDTVDVAEDDAESVARIDGEELTVDDLGHKCSGVESMDDDTEGLTEDCMIEVDGLSETLGDESIFSIVMDTDAETVTGKNGSVE